MGTPDHVLAVTAAATDRLKDVEDRLITLNRRRLEVEAEISPLVSEQSKLRSLLAEYGHQEPLPSAHDRPPRESPADMVHQLLAEVGHPMHYRQIAEELQRRGKFAGGGKDPANSLLATYFSDPRLERTRRGTYAVAKRSTDHPSGAATEDNFIGTRPVAYVFQGETRRVSTFQQVLVGLAALLAQRYPAQFLGVLNLRGRSRVYFSRDARGMKAPKPVSGTDIFVETNLNARDTVTRCREMLALCGLPLSDLHIELRS